MPVLATAEPHLGLHTLGVPIAPLGHRDRRRAIDEQDAITSARDEKTIRLREARLTREREARESARERIRETMGGMDFVSREEFETVKLMAQKAREENEALKARIEALEAALNAKAKK